MKETEAIVSDCVRNKEEREKYFACMIKAVLPSWKNNEERILLPTFGVLPKFPFYGYKTQYKVIFEFLFYLFFFLAFYTMKIDWTLEQSTVEHQLSELLGIEVARKFELVG